MTHEKTATGSENVIHCKIPYLHVWVAPLVDNDWSIYSECMQTLLVTKK